MGLTNFQGNIIISGRKKNGELCFPPSLRIKTQTVNLSSPTPAACTRFRYSKRSPHSKQEPKWNCLAGQSRVLWPAPPSKDPGASWYLGFLRSPCENHMGALITACLVCQDGWYVGGLSLGTPKWLGLKYRKKRAKEEVTERVTGLGLEWDSRKNPKKKPKGRVLPRGTTCTGRKPGTRWPAPCSFTLLMFFPLSKKITLSYNTNVCLSPAFTYCFFFSPGLVWQCLRVPNKDGLDLQSFIF